MAFLRSSACRQLARSLTTSSALRTPAVRTQLHTLSRASPLSPTKPIASKTLALVRYQSDNRKQTLGSIDEKAEDTVAHQRIKPTPDLVSTSSSTRADEVDAAARGHHDDDTDMMAGIRADVQTIKDTFSMADVPKQALYVGMAGVLPYLATSLATVFCAWEINHAGTGWFLSDKTAELALHVIEPIQIGYGAVIISFLGAIHWGLEWAGFGGTQGYPRYAIGVVSTALAWPTLLLPVEYALIGQFLIFNFLYYTDERLVRRGWTPRWYGVYRFALTFIVGAAIVFSLIARGHIADRIGQVHGVADRVKALRDSQAGELEEEEEARRKFLASKDEEDEEE